MQWIISLITGAIGGTAAGAIFKNLSLGPLGNTLSGLVGRWYWYSDPQCCHRRGRASHSGPLLPHAARARAASPRGGRDLLV
jgi:hypothetical protein